MKVLIVTGGRIERDFAFDFLENHRFDKVVVVDGGLAFWSEVEKSGREFDKMTHIVGDFDSIDPEKLHEFISESQLKELREYESEYLEINHKGETVYVRRFNPHKDYTDSDIAAKLAMELIEADEVEKEIWFLGATGTRMDHTLANIQMLEELDRLGYKGVIVDTNNKIRFLGQHAVTIRKQQQFGKYISLIPLTETIGDITMQGFKYPLDMFPEVKRGQSRCVSNELEDEIGQIILGKGKALLIESRD